MEKEQNIEALLFDLDGTLLDINLNKFIPFYAEAIADFQGKIPRNKFIKCFLDATYKVVAHESGELNADYFWDKFCPMVDVPRDVIEPIIQEFYSNVYPTLEKYVTPRPEAIEVLEEAGRQGLKIVIATNPIFPLDAIKARLDWGLLGDFQYDLITSIDDFHACKPNVAFFKEILEKIDSEPGKCLVVGDEHDDMVAARIGCKTFLIDSPMTILKSSTPQPTYRGSLCDLITLLREGRIQEHQEDAGEHYQGQLEFEWKLQRAHETLGDAFNDYPMFAWVLNDESTRARKLAAIQKTVTRFGLQFGTVLATSDEYEGVLVAVDSREDMGPLADWLWLQSGYSEAAEMLGKEALERWKQISKVIEEVRLKYAPDPHVYIISIGVKPGEQGKGHASNLVKKLLDDLARKGMPCYLETFKKANERIYNHLGFTTMESRGIPGTGLTLYSLLKMN